MQKKVNNSKVINFGCRLNSYESEVIKSILKKNKINNKIVINSCAVTNEAEKQVQQSIRKLAKENPKMDIIVTGCAAQINPEKYLSIKGVKKIIGNNDKIKNETWINLLENKKYKIENIFDAKNTNNNIVENFDGKARAYVEIQQGCNHRCTFCIIPYGRGNNRSVPINIIIERIKKLVNNGYKEIVLTGVDITDYGRDFSFKTSLSKIIKEILITVPELNQLRLSSIDCAEIDDEFWDLIQFEERLMPHLHISLQSGNDLILKRMKRRHTRKQAIDFCLKAKKLRPNIVFGADLIAGFPTETEEMFNNTYSLISECNLTYLHIFRYSQKNGTPAAKMPQVSNEIKKTRAKLLRDLGEKQLSNYLETLIGKEKIVLIEKNFENYSVGKTQEYAPIRIEKKLNEGELFKLPIKSINNNLLLA
tara:strand:- start:4659 stop:5921 length:1263 start_codon:yes stop_codon:yes gene_type:complete